VGLLALLGGCLCYLYLPLRAPPGADRWGLLWRSVSGVGVASSWLDPPRLLAEGRARLGDLAARFIWPQFLPLGALLALAGAGRLLWRDHALAALLLPGYALVFLFAAAYYVSDVAVFLIPAYVVAALSLGEGAMLVLLPLPRRAAPRAALALLALPALLLGQNLAPVRAANTASSDALARAIMRQPLPEHTLIVVNWYEKQKQARV
jgi:hypothetical protein